MFTPELWGRWFTHFDLRIIFSDGEPTTKQMSLLVGGNEVSKYEEPSGEGVRVDAALYAGGKPSMHYVQPGMFWHDLGVISRGICAIRSKLPFFPYKMG